MTHGLDASVSQMCALIQSHSHDITTAAHVTSNSADLSWTTGNTSALAYQVRYAVNDGNANWSYANGTGTSASLTGLTSGTQYEWNVREVCAVGDTSTWTQPVVFNTDFCDPQFQCVVTAKLFDSYGDGWNGGQLAIEQKNTAGQWVPVAALGAGFNSAAGSPPGDTLIEYASVCDGDSARLILAAAGSYQKEMGWLITDSNGDTVAYEVGSNCSSLSLDDSIWGDNIKIYPNPTSNTFNIKSSQIELNKIEIYSLLGEKLKEYNVNTSVYNIEDLTSGLYLVKIYSNKGMFTIKKLIKK